MDLVRNTNLHPLLLPLGKLWLRDYVLAMITVLDVYMAVIAANAVSLAVAWIWYRPRQEVRSKQETIIAYFVVAVFIGGPCLYVLISATNSN